MKLLVMATDAVINQKTSKIFDGLEASLDKFLSLEKGNKIVVFSGHAHKLQNIPSKYHRQTINLKIRRNKALIEQLINEHGFQFSNIIILGSKDDDLHLAANSQVLLLNAGYSKSNNPSSKVFEYGISLNTTDLLYTFFYFFSGISNPWYFNAKITDTTTIYALTNANTMSPHQGDDEKSLNNKFKECLKDGKSEYRDLFIIYFLMSIYTPAVVDIFREVDYWGIYPSSGTDTNQDLDYFKETVRKSLNSGPKTEQPILIRKEATSKRHELSQNQRITNACDSQLDTIVINPYYEGKIEGKVICIIDDFTTYGTSCETVRLLLEKAGASKVIFIALGKFGHTYYKFDYIIHGDVFRNYTFKKLSHKSLSFPYSNYNNNANKDLLLSLGKYIKNLSNA
jgi:hypothetical protein